MLSYTDTFLGSTRSPANISTEKAFSCKISIKFQFETKVPSPFLVHGRLLWVLSLLKVSIGQKHQPERKSVKSQSAFPSPVPSVTLKKANADRLQIDNILLQQNLILARGAENEHDLAELWDLDFLSGVSSACIFQTWQIMEKRFRVR